MPRFRTANEILNDVAPEIGVSPVSDPYSSTNQVFQQMKHILNGCGQELVQLHPWQQLVKEHAITVEPLDSGEYDLPDDFAYMMDQTGWDRTNNVPLAGPLSGQDWQYLLGRDLVSHTIYASFRLAQGKFVLFPQPPAEGLKVHFEYINCCWVKAGDADAYRDVTEKGSDIVLFDPILIKRYVKAKYLEAKGFDSQKAREDFGYMFDAVTGKDEGAPILNASRLARGYPYLDTFRSTPDTNYGN